MSRFRLFLFMGVLPALAVACTDILGIADGIGYIVSTDGGVTDANSADVASFDGATDAPTADGAGPADATILPDGGSLFDAGTGCDADLLLDPHNCGTCGNDCLGSGCGNGLCTPTVLAVNQPQPSGIAVDSTNVYWTNNEPGDASVVTCPLSNCNANITTFAFALQQAPGVVMTYAGVSPIAYFTYTANAAGGLGFYEEDAGQVVTTALTNAPSASAIAADTFDVFFATPTAIDYCPVGPGCSGTPPTIGAPQVVGLAAYAGVVYWTDSSENVTAQPLDGGAQVFYVVLGSGAPQGIAADGDNVYWTNSSLGTVQQCPASGCDAGPITLASSQPQPFNVVVDSNFVYWTDPQLGAIFKCAIGTSCGTKPIPVALGQTQPFGIALDATHVYWTDTGANGTVMSVAK